MAEASLGIGGMEVRLTGAEGVRMALSLPGMEVFAVRGGHLDATLMLDADLTMPECRTLHSFDIADGGSVCRFGVDAEGVYWYQYEGFGWLRFDGRKPDEVRCSHIVDASVLRFALWTAWSMLGLWRGVLPVHSSTVVCDGRAVMCLGESGTGKSTHTRLWLENIENTCLLNDDSPLLAVEEGGAVVYGSPWSGKTPCYHTECRPVAALLRLEQRTENSIRRLGVVEAFTAVQPSCPPCLAREERCLDKLVAYVSDVLERVPVYRMGCLPDAAAARMSHDTIYNAER